MKEERGFSENGHEAMHTSTDLHGRDFATLTELELNCFRVLRTDSRKFGLIVSVEVMDDSEDIQAELATASPSQQEDIYRQLSTQISVRPAGSGAF